LSLLMIRAVCVWGGWGEETGEREGVRMTLLIKERKKERKKGRKTERSAAEGGIKVTRPKKKKEPPRTLNDKVSRV
jgi:hypothetical protein